ncbi:cytochrome P450 [Rhizodiscina lignyota]|uniref:Cytochrome P450 n=1 Tax=Rhizodiscina lignyota TaxID=1504668 RepID=A0A9P4IDV0_9PEZI|nr:cytochrome P450 [Rhizodiscina lignyota]
MALSLTSIVAVLAIFYFIYSYINSAIAERKFQKFARDNGCSAPFISANKLPWGIDRLWIILRAQSTGLDVLDDLIYKGQAAVKWTNEGSGIFGRKGLSTSEPKNLQAVLATKFKDFEQGELRHKQFGALLGVNVFNSDGPFWEHSRAMIRPQFSRDQINDLDDTEHSTQLFVQAIPIGADGWGELDIGPLFYRFTLDTATAFLFGSSVDSLKAALPGVDVKQLRNEAERFAQERSKADVNFSEAVSLAQTFLANRIRLQGLYWLADTPAFRRSVAYIRNFTGYYVQMALNATGGDAEKGYNTSKKYNLMTALASECRDEVELRDQILALLFAGRDTTSALLSWVFLEIAQRPDVQQKLRQAVQDDFGNDAQKLNFATLKSCKYLQHVLNETLRYWPTVPVNNRTAVRDTVLPVGGGPNRDQPVAVRKGQLVNMMMYAMHRRKDIWGEDALEFKPERWESRKLDWAFVPFSGGPRICLGQQFALTEAAYLTVRILQTFDKIEWAGPAGKPRKGLGLTLFPRDGVRVRVRKAVR